MTLAGLSLRDRTEYEQGSAFEAALRVAIEHVPAWLYDASELGTVIDDLNRARHHYEVEHPEEPRIETAGPDA